MKIYFYSFFRFTLIIVSLILYSIINSYYSINQKNICNNDNQTKIFYNYQKKYFYVKSDSLLRKRPNFISDVITIVIKGTKVQKLKKTKKDFDLTKYL